MGPADPAELYRNDGGTWTDISATLPQEAHEGYTFSSGFYDVNDDRRPELFIGNDFGKIRPSVLLWNDGSGGFTADLNWHPGWEDMGMGVADLNGDQKPDFLMSSWKSVSLVVSGDAVGLPGTWINDLSIVADPDNRNQVYGWGSDFGDIDNDSDLDAVVLFGYWSTYDNPGDPDVQVDGLWLQGADGTFEQVQANPEWSINDKGHGRGFILADVNNDGWLDVIKREINAPSPLYLSQCGTEAWARVSLRAPAPNTHAIGATVQVVVNGQTQTRWIHTGSSGMYAGQPPEAHFGLGSAAQIDSLIVTWPDGTRDTFTDLEPRQRFVVTRSEP